MKDTKIKLVKDGRGDGVTRFGDVLASVLDDRKMSQFELATQVDYSQPAISRVESGDRSLTPRLAARLADVLGSTKEKWLSVYDKTQFGSSIGVDGHKAFLFGTAVEAEMPGVHIRRMQEDDILRFFAEGTGEMTFRGITEPCEISEFDRKRVQTTSYDTVIGGYIDPRDSKENKTIEVLDALQIPSFERRILVAKEHITLPTWLEADLHPASNLAMKGLIVSHGPIIDPGWSGFLRVSVFNPTPKEVEVTAREPFLTLRFWMQDVL